MLLRYIFVNEGFIKGVCPDVHSNAACWIKFFCSIKSTPLTEVVLAIKFFWFEKPSLLAEPSFQSTSSLSNIVFVLSLHCLLQILSCIQRRLFSNERFPVQSKLHQRSSRSINVILLNPGLQLYPVFVRKIWVWSWIKVLFLLKSFHILSWSKSSLPSSTSDLESKSSVCHRSALCPPTPVDRPNWLAGSRRSSGRDMSGMYILQHIS